MTEYTINGRQYLVHEGKLFAEVVENGAGSPRPVDALNVKVTEPDGESPRRTFKRRILSKAKTAKAVKERTVRHCKQCGEPGHDTRKCPKGNPLAGQVEDSDPLKTGLSDAEIETRVHELQDEGKGSLSIARELGIPLIKVNKYWQRTCGRCGKTGHEYPNCPDLDANPSRVPDLTAPKEEDEEDAPA